MKTFVNLIILFLALCLQSCERVKPAKINADLFDANELREQLDSATVTVIKSQIQDTAIDLYYKRRLASNMPVTIDTGSVRSRFFKFLQESKFTFALSDTYFIEIERSGET